MFALRVNMNVGDGESGPTYINCVFVKPVVKRYYDIILTWSILMLLIHNL